MTTPAAKPCARARNAIAGVVMTPADSTVAPTPAEVMPAVNMAAIQLLDSLVSIPRRIFGRGVVRASECARARPMAWTVAGSSGGWPGDGADAVRSKELLHVTQVSKNHYQGV